MAAINRNHFNTEAHDVLDVCSIGQTEGLLFLAGLQCQLNSGLAGPDTLRTNRAAAVTDQADIAQCGGYIDDCGLAWLQHSELAGGSLFHYDFFSDRFRPGWF